MSAIDTPKNIHETVSQTLNGAIVTAVANSFANDPDNRQLPNYVEIGKQPESTAVFQQTQILAQKRIHDPTVVYTFAFRTKIDGIDANYTSSYSTMKQCLEAQKHPYIPTLVDGKLVDLPVLEVYLKCFPSPVRQASN